MIQWSVMLVVDTCQCQYNFKYSILLITKLVKLCNNLHKIGLLSINFISFMMVMIKLLGKSNNHGDLLKLIYKLETIMIKY